MQKSYLFGRIRRRLVLFPTRVDQCLSYPVGKAKPRALVILAHYFALFGILKLFRFVGNTGLPEVRAIAAYMIAE